MFAKLIFLGPGPELLIEYIDEDNEVWGSELWDASKGRLNGGKYLYHCHILEQEANDMMRPFEVIA
jgi:hypothetical protein